jgi:hypothetical protein
VRDLSSRIVLGTLTWIGLGSAAAWAQPGAPKAAQEPDAKGKAAPEVPQVKIEPVPEIATGPTLKTTPVLRSAPLRNLVVVDSTPLPRDEIARRKGLVEGVKLEEMPKDLQKFWVLDFAFKPIRIRTVETNHGRRNIYYLYYRVINRTGKPRMFAPQFTLVTDDGRVFDEMVLPRAPEEIERREKSKALQAIEAKEGSDIPLLGAVENIGIIPPSGEKEGVDDAVYGVAVWELTDPIARADSFRIYVTGLSNGSYPDKLPNGTAINRYKTLRIDFASPGDERNRGEYEIRLLDPPYTWEYPEPIQGRKASPATRTAGTPGVKRS